MRKHLSNDFRVFALIAVLLLSSGAFFIPQKSFAATLVENSAATTTVTYVVTGTPFGYAFYLGGGLSGNPTSVVFGPGGCANGGCDFASGGTITWQIACSTTPGVLAYNGSGNCTDFTTISGSYTATTTLMAPGPPFNPYSPFGTTTSLFATGTYGTASFNPAEYYTLSLTGNHDLYLTAGYYSVAGKTAPTFAITDDGGYGPPLSTSIITVSPSDGQTVGTSTAMTIGATGYLSAADLAAHDYIALDIDILHTGSAGSAGSIYTAVFHPECQTSPYTLAGGVPAYCLVYLYVSNHTGALFNIGSSGYWTLSTSTKIADVGRYRMTTRIVHPTVSFLGVNVGETDIVSTTTSFIVDQLNYFDTVTDAIVQAQSSVVSTTTTAALSLYCNPVSGFDISKCSYTLFVPSDTDMTLLFTKFKDSFLTRFPVGYFTRLTTVLLLPTAVEPPGISYTFGSSSPAVLQGKTYSINIWDNAGIVSTIRADDGSNKNVFDIVDPVVTIMVAFAVALVVLEDLSGLRIGEPSSSSSTNSVDTMEMEVGGKPTRFETKTSSSRTRVGNRTEVTTFRRRRKIDI